MKAIIHFSVLLLVFATEAHLSAKGHEKKSLNRKAHLHDTAKLHPISHKSHHHNAKRIKNRNWPSRCRIVCSIVLPGDCGGYNNTVTSTTATVTHPKTQSTSTRPYDSSEEFDDDTTDISERKTSPALPPVNPTKQTTASPIKAKENSRRAIYPNYSIKTSKLNTRHKIGRFHQLSKIQKRILLKKLKLANSHGRKSYKFWQINPFLCSIECDEVFQQNVFESPVSPQSSASDEAEESDSDSYEEGEDTPIEVTIKPFVPENLEVEGVKPFGLVDFMGFDDFGANGEPANDFQFLYEDKSRKKRKEKRRKHNT